MNSQPPLTAYSVRDILSPFYTFARNAGITSPSTESEMSSDHFGARLGSDLPLHITLTGLPPSPARFAFPVCVLSPSQLFVSKS